MKSIKISEFEKNSSMIGKSLSVTTEKQPTFPNKCNETLMKFKEKSMLWLEFNQLSYLL